MRLVLAVMALALAGCDRPKVVFENSTTVPENVSDQNASDASH